MPMKAAPPIPATTPMMVFRVSVLMPLVLLSEDVIVEAVLLGLELVEVPVLV